MAVISIGQSLADALPGNHGRLSFVLGLQCLLACRGGTETRWLLTLAAWLMARLSALKPFMPVHGVEIKMILGRLAFTYCSRADLSFAWNRCMPTMNSKFGPPVYPRLIKNAAVPPAPPQSHIVCNPLRGTERVIPACEGLNIVEKDWRTVFAE